MKKLIFIAVISAVMTGCSTAYTCKLGYECISVEESYEAARADGGNKESVIFQSDRKKAENTKLKGSKTDVAQRAQRGRFSGFSGEKLTDRPVYMPPKPLRIWIAPWVDEMDEGQNYLLSGQFMYITTGGGWQMGELNRSGRAGELIFKPQLPTVIDTKRVAPKTNVLQP